MRPVLIVPGIGNSGPAHWQSLWEQSHAGVHRVAQRDWNHPVCDEWIAQIDLAVAEQSQPPIVVAHSLGCLAVAHWAARSARGVFRIMMVAVPDPLGPHFPADASGFAPLPVSLGERHLTIVCSGDDPYATASLTRRLAANWGAQLVHLGSVGHINAESGLGAWDQGWSIVAGWRSLRSK